jgi:hypothetical protein
MITLQKPSIRIELKHLPVQTQMNSATLEHYLRGLSFPAGKREVVAAAEVNGAPENVMAFFTNRLPVRTFRSVGDVSFTVFASSYFFGQD